MSQLKKEDLAIKEENKDNFKESIITRSNLVNEFKIADIEQYLATLNKMKKEIDGTVGLAEKMIENIEKNHDELIKKVSEEERSHLWLYQENMNIVGEGKPKQKEIDEEISKHNEYLDIIYDAFGFQDVVEIKKGEGANITTGDNAGKIKRTKKG